jgi:hypothetical protein
LFGSSGEGQIAQVHVEAHYSLDQRGGPLR